MSDENEIVMVEMVTDARMRLYSQITGRMQELGYNPVDFSALDLGFELPAGWPMDVGAQPLLSQLVVIAHKLKLRIVISDLNVVPLKIGADDPEAMGDGDSAAEQ